MSLLSLLTFGLVGGKSHAPSKDSIAAQIAGQVLATLNAKCWSVDAQTAKNSAGYNLNLLSAWDLVLTDPNTTQEVVNKTISDLLASNLIFVMPGCLGAGLPVSPDGTVKGNVQSNAAGPVASGVPLTVPSNTMLLAGAGVIGLVLLSRRHHARRG